MNIEIISALSQVDKAAAWLLSLVIRNAPKVPLDKATMDAIMQPIIDSVKRYEIAGIHQWLELLRFKFPMRHFLAKYYFFNFDIKPEIVRALCKFGAEVTEKTAMIILAEGRFDDFNILAPFAGLQSVPITGRSSQLIINDRPYIVAKYVIYAPLTGDIRPIKPQQANHFCKRTRRIHAWTISSNMDYLFLLYHGGPLSHVGVHIDLIFKIAYMIIMSAEYKFQQSCYDSWVDAIAHNHNARDLSIKYEKANNIYYRFI